MSRSFRLLLVLFALLALSLAGCQQGEPTTPTATVPPLTATPSSTDTPTPVAEEQPTQAPEPAIIVLGQPFTLEELQALEQTTAEEGDRSATGVSLLALLDAAGVTATDIVLVARDGYAANVSVADIADTAVLSYTEDGLLDAMLPGLPRNTWVHDVVEIREASEPSGEAEKEDESLLLDEPLELTDAAGRTVRLEALPQRILVVGRGPHMSLHVLYMFEEGRERLIGSESRAATPSDFLPMVDPRFSEIEILAANPNVEQIVALAPDLVIMKGLMEDATATALGEVGIPVLYVNLETVEEFFQDLANIGAVLGNTERAEEIAAYYQTRLDLLAERMANLAEEDKPDVLLMSYSDRGGEVAVQVPAAAWMQTTQVVRAGGHPVWLDSAAPTDGWTVVNLEQISQWNPDMIFVIVPYSADPQAILDSLKADSNWAALQAVQNGQMYGFPRDVFGWDQPEPRWILGMQWLATKIHPELFSDLDIDAEVVSYFSQLYGMSQTSIEEHIYPILLTDVH